MQPTGETSAGHGGSERFATTRWSVVAAAQGRSSPASREALSVLFEAYWYPLYAYVRRRGHSVEEAEDLTQGFFARLLEKHGLEAAAPERGRFRSYLLGALKHFLANEWDQSRARKRGGAVRRLPLDLENAEARYSLEPGHELTPEKVYERRWALTLLELVLSRLEAEHAGKKARSFQRLKSFLTGDGGCASYAQAAAELDLSEGAVKVAVHRLRRRYRDLLRREIAQTVDSEEAIEDEVRHLFEALGS
jgi:RNA polymerase sigma factor (sigma-70 family)